MGKAAIVIVNTGSPAAPTAEAVRPYLRSFLSDSRICPMNPIAWRLILNLFILPSRAPKSAAKYASIWTDDGSPLDATMRALACKVEAACASAGDARPIVRHAMSYSSPSVEEVLRECAEAGCDDIAVVPLYPQGAFSTTGSVCDKVDRVARELERIGSRSVRISLVDDYSGHPAYISAIARSISSAGFDHAAGDMLLFAFHSIPMTDIEAGDSYAEQVERTVRDVAAHLELPPDVWRLGYQCRFDKSRKWLGPTTSEVLQECFCARRLFVVAPNFAVDCLETLHDIDVELRAKYESACEGGVNGANGTNSANGVNAGKMVYVPCLNDSDAHAQLIASLKPHPEMLA